MARNTYDPTTDVGKVRMYTGDRNITNPTWTDAEIGVFLTETSYQDHVGVVKTNPKHAAAVALRALYVQVATKAKVVKLGSLTIDKKSNADALLAAADDLMESVLLMPFVSSPRQIFRMHTLGIATGAGEDFGNMGNVGEGCHDGGRPGRW